MTREAPGLLLVISGPSGVGKSVIAHAIEARLGGAFSVSMTTRPQNPKKETDGVDYHFVDDAQFDVAIERGELLEWANVFEHRYGTPRGPVEQMIAAGRVVILEIDIEGGKQVRAACPDAMTLFILPREPEVLLNRLRERRRDDEATIRKRFAEAQREMAEGEACGVYDHFIVNDDLERAIDEVTDLIESRRARMASYP